MSHMQQYRDFSHRWIQALKGKVAAQLSPRGLYFGRRFDPSLRHPFEDAAERLFDSCDRLIESGLPGPIVPVELCADLNQWLHIHLYDVPAGGAGEAPALIEPTRRFSDLCIAVWALERNEFVYDKVFLSHGGPREE